LTATARFRGLGRVGLLVAALSAIGLRAPVADAVVPLATAPPQHVAVVIAGQGSYCTRWHSGMTGADALQAVASVTWGTGPYAGGFVVGINGVMTNPTQRFWSYWHGGGGGWSFSDLGLTGYSVPAGGLEGWSISATNGARTAPPPASYAGVCAGADAPPPPATTARPPATPPPHATTVSAPRPAPATSADGGATPPPVAGSVAGAAPRGARSLASSGPAASLGSAGAATSRSQSGPSGSASSATSSAVTLSGSASSTSGPTSVDAAPASRATLNTGSPLPVIVGGAVGLLLLAAAGAYAWRRSRTG
jgi:hypothetical protein